MSFDMIEFDSPIEFVVVGPVDGHDTVLARSRGAGIDLVGLSISDFQDYGWRGPADIISSLFPRSRQTNSVRAPFIADRIYGSDSRASDIVFSWVGAASKVDMASIENVLKIHSREIMNNVRLESRIDLELSLSFMVLQCSRANERRSRFRRLLIATALLYGVLGILSSGFVSLAYFTQHVVR